jgi:hypothetical protein
MQRIFRIKIRLDHEQRLHSYAAKWFGLVWVSTSENQTGVDLISCSCDVVSVRFGSGFYRFGPERLYIEFIYIYVESYWLAKEWIATAAYLKWMRNPAYYIENLSHSSIYWSLIFWFIEIHLRTEIFVCHENFFFWSSYLRFSLSLRSDLIRIAYSSSNSLISRRSRKSVNLKKIISIEWL